MASYDPFLRRKRTQTINDPLKPLPNYIPPMGSGATVGELDEGVKRQTQFNRSLFAPGGLAPYYGGSSYTQSAQQSQPMRPLFAGGMPVIAPRPPVASPMPSVVPQDESAFFDDGAAGVARPAQNAIQRWQGGTSLDQRPAPQPHFTAGQLRRGYTGRIGGPAMPSPQDRPLGFTPQAQWEQQFTPQIQIPKARRPVSGYLWER